MFVVPGRKAQGIVVFFFSLAGTGFVSRNTEEKAEHFESYFHLRSLKSNAHTCVKKIPFFPEILDKRLSSKHVEPDSNGLD